MKILLNKTKPHGIHKPMGIHDTLFTDSSEVRHVVFSLRMYPESHVIHVFGLKFHRKILISTTISFYRLKN